MSVHTLTDTYMCVYLNEQYLVAQVTRITVRSLYRSIIFLSFKCASVLELYGFSHCHSKHFPVYVYLLACPGVACFFAPREVRGVVSFTQYVKTKFDGCIC